MDSSHPLYGAQLRFERADGHLANADGLIDAFGRACIQYIVTEYDVKAGKKRLSLTKTAPLPPMLPLVVSDAIHNLRAAFDYIVYELARHDSGKVQDGTQFIIEDVKSDPINRNRGFDARSKKCLKGLTRLHVDAIEGLQPYQGVEWTKTLRDISDPDKHRELIALEDFGFYTVTVHGRGGELDGADLPGDEFEIDAHNAIFIAPPDRSQPPLISTLRRLEAEVTGTIELFKPEFKI